jgi:hypothetical protein
MISAHSPSPHLLCNQTLTWVNITAREQEAALRAAESRLRRGKGGSVDDAGVEPDEKEGGETAGGKKAAGKGGSSSEKAPLVIPTFTISPKSIELKPNTGCWFTLTGNAPKPGLVMEAHTVEAKIGKDKQVKRVFDCTFRADFILPMLQPSVPTVEFSHVYEPEVPLAVQSRPLSLRNVCALPLDFVLRASTPFSIDTFEFHLEPQEVASVILTFDPGYRDDRQSHIADGQLVAVFRNHPNRFVLPLRGTLVFPNLDISSATVDFGCILNDTSKTMTLNLHNPTPIPVTYGWTFVEEEESVTAGKTGLSSRRAVVPVNQAFDILPIRSTLAPYESENVEFILYGHAGRKFRAQALCVVSGGPEYNVSLLGEANNVSYRLDRQFLDFGRIVYSLEETREFSILNVGKVPFNFRVQLDRLSRSGVILVSPLSGRIAGGDKQRLQVKFKPGVPDRLMERLVLEIAHFEPVEFPVIGFGMYASVSVALPRHDPQLLEDDWTALLEEARFALFNPPPPLISQLSAPGTASGAVPVGTLTSAAPSRIGTANAGVSRDNLGTPVGPERPAHAGPRTGTAGSSHSTSAAPSRAAGAAQVLAAIPSAPQPITALDVEAEAYRRLYARHLLKEIAAAKAAAEAAREASMLAAPSVGGVPEVIDAPGAQSEAPLGLPKIPILPLGGNVPGVSSSTEKPARQRASSIAASDAHQTNHRAAASDDSQKAPPFVLSRHVLDFGNVVVGSVKKKTFKITNTGHLPVTIELNKHTVAAKGFAIEPEKIAKLAEGASATMTVVFHAKKNAELVPVSAEVPLEIKNGPPITLSLMANVTIPDVRLVPESMDFGRITCGQVSA